MIPSDHFVRFYNEVFKFLDEKNELTPYYQEISRHQELHCYECFMDKGLLGMEEYWGHIRKEENCVSYSEIINNVRYSYMNVCPSLSKVLDSDASPCEKYCAHCPGWLLPLMTKCGFYCGNTIIDPKEPHCRGFQTEDFEKAKAALQKWLDDGFDPKYITTNFDDYKIIEENKKIRQARQAK